MATTIDAIPELDRKGLREFGLVTGAIVAVLFGLFFPWVFERGFPIWPWVVLGVLGAWALIAPGTLGPVYKGWMRFGILLNKITSPIVMGVMFIVLIVPIGLIMRLAKRDPMHRSFDRSLDTYRTPSQRPPKDNMEKPF